MYGRYFAYFTCRTYKAAITHVAVPMDGRDVTAVRRGMSAGNFNLAKMEQTALLVLITLLSWPSIRLIFYYTLPLTASRIYLMTTSVGAPQVMWVVIANKKLRNVHQILAKMETALTCSMATPVNVLMNLQYVSYTDVYHYITILAQSGCILHMYRELTVKLTSIAVALLPVVMEELVKISQMASMCALVLLGTLASTVKESTTASPLPATIKAPVL